LACSCAIEAPDITTRNVQTISTRVILIELLSQVSEYQDREMAGAPHSRAPERKPRDVLS
jgi:hypothetical protein